jgi:endonuclease/exonuclease/phosphatase family metal-dependent hydrolase
MVGDFNAVPSAPSVVAVAAFLTDAWTALYPDQTGYTIPVRKPTRRIDYVWITPASLTPLKMWIPSTEASDHLPIVADLQLR